MNTPHTIKFAADVMLGRLARWLRMIGYDTFYENRISDEELVRVCLSEDRVLLTRDRALLARKDNPPALYVNSDNFKRQLAQVIVEFDLTIDERFFFKRCPDCNAPLEPVEPSAVEGLVPYYVFKHSSRFARCPVSDKIFWEGTHPQKAQDLLKEVLAIATQLKLRL